MIGGWGGGWSLEVFRTQSYELAKDAVRYISRGEDYGPPPSRLYFNLLA